MRFSRESVLAGVVIVFIIALTAVYLLTSYAATQDDMQASDSDDDGAGVTLTDHSFEDLFSRHTIIEEAAEMNESASPYWWISSGAYVKLEAGKAHTIQGDLPEDEEWRQRFAEANAESTDDGYHPQNIFRMVTRTRWLNFRQQCYFRINQLNLSDAETRNQTNGLLLFNRYQDQNNLYYAGLRVDGTAIIKKKYQNVYYTLAQETVIDGVYDRATNPNLLPLDIWIGLASEIENQPDGTVEIRLYSDIGMTGEWTLVATALDDGVSYGGPFIHQEGYAGIRTDFMDVSFESYRITKTR